MNRNEKDFFKAIQDMERRLRIVERNNVGGAGGGTGLETLLDVANFDNLLTSAEVDAQKAFDKLDDALNGAIQVFGGTLGGELTGIKTITTTHISSGLTNNGNKITVSQAGKYYVHAQQLVSTGAGSAIYFHIRKNGVTQVYGYINANTPTTDAIADAILDCVAGDYIDIYIQNSCTSVWGSTHSNLSVFKITQGQKGEKGLNWKGAWSVATAYIKDDLVSYNGATYVCLQNHTGQQPPNSTYWDLFVTGNQSLVPYIKLGMSASQAVNLNDIVAFNVVRSSNGITNSGNGINLKAGKTYRVIAFLNTQTAGATGTSYVGYQLTDGTNVIGQNAYSAQNNSSSDHGMKAPVWEYITPSTDITVYVKIIDDGLNAGGVLVGSWNCLFVAEEVVAGAKGDKGLNFKGSWNTAVAYVADDVVSYDGAAYVCLVAHTNQVPPNATYWAQLVAGTAADTVDGFHASATPEANKLLALDAGGKIPAAAYGNDANFTAASFQNGWSDYTGYSPAGYFKDALGFVHLRGLIKNGTVSWYPSVTAFTLPVGYRPAYRKLFGVISNGAIGRVDVDENGNVVVLSPSTNPWVQLDGLYFKAGA